MNNIEPIYVVFAIFLATLGLIKNKKVQFWGVFFSFVIIFVMAEVGPDYSGYKMIYESNAQGEIAHGELLYSYLNKFCVSLGISYNLFRVGFLSLFVFLLIYSINKITNKTSVCFLMYYFAFIVYLISAYRQLAIISVFIFSIYVMFYKSKKNNIVWNCFVLGINFLAIFIHTAAIFQFLIICICVLFEFVKINKLKIINDKIINNLPLVLLLCLCIRFIICGLLEIFPSLQHLISNIPYNNEWEVLGFGQMSRLIILLNLYEMYKNKRQSKQIQSLFVIYTYSMLLYFVLPFDLLLGRLINTIRFLEPILFLNMLEQYNEFECYRLFKFKMSKRSIYIIAMIGTYVLIFMAQMILQTGYEYKHMFFKVN